MIRTDTQVLVGLVNTTSSPSRSPLPRSPCHPALYRGRKALAARECERSSACEPGPLTAHVFEHEGLSQSGS